MAESSFNSVVNSLLDGMEGFLSSKTVVGEPVVVGDTILIPFVDVSFGVGAGTFRGDKKDNGAGGLTGKMTPTAVLVQPFRFRALREDSCACRTRRIFPRNVHTHPDVDSDVVD